METTRIREPKGSWAVASSLRSERYSPGPLRLSNARSFLDSTSNLYLDYVRSCNVKVFMEVSVNILMFYVSVKNVIYTHDNILSVKY